MTGNTTADTTSEADRTIDPERLRDRTAVEYSEATIHLQNVRHFCP